MAMDSVSGNLSSLQHKRCGLLKDRLQLVKRTDCHRYEIAPMPEAFSFEKGFFLFIRACQLLTQNTEGVVIVGLAGPSGAGKTVFSEKVSNFMPGIATISMDNYNDCSRIVDGNYDDPRLTDYDLLLQNISDLKAGKAIDVPIYDFKLSSRAGYRKLELPSSRIVIIEGIYALSEKLCPLLDLRVSVTGGVHFDLVKRILRDIGRSGQAPEDIIHQVSETVYPMYKAFIEPDLETAHIKIVNRFNPFSGLQSPTYILKSSRLVTQERIRDVLSYDHVEATEETYDIYLLPPGEDPETCQSYLRMRNRDGKYSLMFEECLTDNTFMITPRITFGVSVRLLGGLMALGYTIATILKRFSQVYSDERICVKIDKLENLHQTYIQVQGKERCLVAEAARKLGLDGSYIPHPYIEQIQLEKLIAEVRALPDDLKTKLSINDISVANPFSWISEVNPRVNNLYNQSMPSNHTKKRHGKPHSKWAEAEANGKDYDDIGPDSLTSFHGDGGCAPFIEHLDGLSERIDDLVMRLGEVETKLSSSCNRIHNVVVGSLGNGAGGSLYMNGHANGLGMGYHHSPPMSASNTPSAMESSVIEEVRMLSRGQRHLIAQLDIMGSLLRENITHMNQDRGRENRGWWDGLLVKLKTDPGLATATGILFLGLGSVAGIVMVRIYR